MSAVLDALRAWSRRGDRIALATVVETKKSAPQPAGTKMAISGNGDVVGAVSGGCVEGAVVEVAEGILGGAESRLLVPRTRDQTGVPVLAASLVTKRSSKPLLT